MKFYMLIIFLIVSFNNRFAQVEVSEYEIPITFSITNTGINRNIAHQWTQITHYWSGNEIGFYYEIELKRPIISLSNNVIEINLSLELQTPFYNGTIIISPALTIPNNTLEANEIITKYLNLRSKIDEITQFLNAELKNKIESVLAPIDWVINKGKIINESTGRITEDAYLKWKGLPTLSYEVNNNEINITLTEKIEADAPFYHFQWNRPNSNHPGDFGVRILSNNKFTIDKLKFFQGEYEFPLNFRSPIPVTATFDAVAGKYIAEVHIRATNNPLWGLGNLIYRVVFSRNSNQMAYILHFSSIGLNANWTYINEANIGVIRGE